MTTDAQKAELLEDFQGYLEQSRFEQVIDKEQPDLHTLLSELVEVKTEVKAESRQFKNTLDTLTLALDTIKTDNESLSRELVDYKQRLEQQAIDITRQMLLDMIDIYDRLTTGSNVLENYQPSTTLFKKSKKKDIRFIKHFKEGHNMTIRRFEELLRQNHIKTIDCVGKMFDPEVMNAVETEKKLEIENGIVLEELRKGFLFQDHVLRLAEVKVNKMNPR